jgi:hypothetical protein
MHIVYGLLATIGLVAVIVFAFRQGFSLKPRKAPHGNDTGDAVALLADRDAHKQQ